MRSAILALLGLILLAALFVGLAAWSAHDEGISAMRIQTAGWEAGMAGVPPEACPYSSGWRGNPESRRAWLIGWADGWKERRQWQAKGKKDKNEVKP